MVYHDAINHHVQILCINVHVVAVTMTISTTCFFISLPLGVSRSNYFHLKFSYVNINVTSLRDGGVSYDLSVNVEWEHDPR